MPTSLPLVGAEAVILGMAAFNTNARTVQQQLYTMGIAASRLDRAASGSFLNIAGGFNQMQSAAKKASEVVATAHQASIDAAGKAARAEQASANARVAAFEAALAAGRKAAEQRKLEQYQDDVAQKQRDLRLNTLGQTPATAKAIRLTEVPQIIAGQEEIAAQRRVAQAAARTAASRQAAATAAERDYRLAANAAAQASDAEVRALQASEQAAAQAAASRQMLATAVASTAVVIGTALVTALGAAEASSAKFSAEMGFAASVGELTSAQTQKLSRDTLELARGSLLGSTALAQLDQELLKAGVSAEQLSGATLKATNDLMLASRGELSAADAAKTVAVGFGAFHADATRTVNAATAAVQRSTLSFSDYAAAVRMGGGAAAQFGLTIEEFGAIVGTSARSVAMSGSQIGAGLTQMFIRLQKPSKDALAVMHEYGISLYDTQGKARPFIDILRDLNTHFSTAAVQSGKITQAQRDNALATLFTSRAIREVLPLLDQGTAGYEEMLASIQNLTASGLAAPQLLTTSGIAKQLANNIQVLGIAFGAGLDPYVNAATGSLLKFFQSIDLDTVTNLGLAVGRDVYNAFANLGNILGSHVTPNMTLFQAIALAAATVVAVRMAAMAYGVIESLIMMADAYLTTAIPALIDFAAAAGLTAGGVLLATGAIAAGAALLVVAWRKNWLNLQDITIAVGNNIVAVSQRLANTIAGLLDQAQQAAQDLGIIKGEVAPEGDAIRPRKMTAGEAFLRGVDASVGALKAVPAAAGDAGESIKALAGSFGTAIDAIKNFKPGLHDFAGDVDNAAKKAAEARDRMIEALGKKPPMDFGTPTEPGSYFDKPDNAAAKKIQSAKDRADELMRDFRDDVGKQMNDIARDLAKLYDKADDGMTKALDKFTKDVTQALQQAQEKVGQLVFDRLFKDDAKKRTDDLKKSQDKAARLRQEGLDDAEVTHQRDLEDLKKQQDAEREYRERTNDRVLEDAARARQQNREDEDRVYEAGQQASRDDLEKKQNLAEQALQHNHDRRERELKDSQDQRERDLKAQFDTEKQALQDRQKLRDINDEDARERAKAQTEYNKQIKSGVKESIARTRLNESLGKLDEKKSDAMSGFQQDVRNREEMDALEADQQKRSLDLQNTFRAESLKQEQDFEDEKTKLHEQQEKDRKALDARLEKEALARRRARELEDAQFQRDQEADRRKFRADEDAKALVAQRKLEDDERVRKRGQDELDRQFRDDQEKARETLQKTIEDEEFGRRVTAIYAERDERLRVLDQTLASEQDKVRAQLGEDLVDFRNHLGDRLTEVQRNYLDKLQDLLKTGGAALQPTVDIVTNSISQGLYNIRDAAQEAVNKLAEVFGAVDALNKANEAAGRAKAVINLPSKQYGGVVDGAYGSKQLIMAHGGERFEGIGGYATANTAVRAAEAMWSRGIGASTTITNSATYSVQANYGRVQDEGSIAQDLSALVALTRR